MDRLLWYVFAGSRGGPTRIRIMNGLLRTPLNVNQVATQLGLDYKTAEYNLRVLLKHNLVVRDEPVHYGTPYFPSKNLLAKIAEYETIAQSVVRTTPTGPADRSAGAESGKT